MYANHYFCRDERAMSDRPRVPHTRCRANGAKLRGGAMARVEIDDDVVVVIVVVVIVITVLARHRCNMQRRTAAHARRPPRRTT